MGYLLRLAVEAVTCKSTESVHRNPAAVVSRQVTFGVFSDGPQWDWKGVYGLIADPGL